MNSAATMPDETKLRGLLDGTLSEAEQTEVLALVEAHPQWQQALDRLAAGAQTWQAAANHLHEPPLVADAALRSAIAAVQPPTIASDQPLSHGDARLDFLTPADDPRYLGRFGDYLVESVVGRGGFGIVLQAFDPPLRRIVALKVLAPHLASNKAACLRFEREAKAAAAVVHDHVITIHAVGESPLPHLVMQFVAGQSLQEKLDHAGPLTVNEVLRIGMQTAAGLAAAHKQGQVHRDIKPPNILLENGVERVKITDFGLARAADDASMTQSGVVAGTPQYMSPEQARGETVDFRSDLFSLGSVLYAMCVGHPPFRATTTMGVLKRVCEEPPRPIREINPEVPDWLAAIIDKLMAKNPADRYATAAEVSELLGQCLSHVQQPSAAPLPQVSPVCQTGPVSQPESTPQAPAGGRDRQADDALLDRARRAVHEPAIGLIIAGILNWMALAFALLFLVLTFGASLRVGVWLIPVFVVFGLGSAMLILGGLKLLRLESYPLVLAAGIAALFIGPVYFIGVPMGLWTLVVLQRREVKDAFTKVRRRHWPGIADAPPEFPEEGEWSCRCLTCGYIAPLHKWGGVRIGAASRGKWSVLWCPSCRWLRWMSIEKFSAKSLPPKKPPIPTAANDLPTKPSGGIGLVLLVLFLVIVIPLTLLAAGVAGYYFLSSSPSESPRMEFGPIDRRAPTAELTVECPDPRFELAIQKAPNGCAYASSSQKLEANRPIAVPLGRYCLRVLDGDVVVQESEFEVAREGELVTRRIKPGGTLRFIAEPGDRRLVLKLAGFTYRKSWNWPNELTFFVPEGPVHVELMRSLSPGGGTRRILIDKYFEIVAGEETIIRVRENDIELITEDARFDPTVALHRENLKVIEERHAAGAAPIEEVLEARLKLHQAHFEWADKLGRHAQALSIRKEMVTLAEEVEKLAEKQHAAGLLGQEAVNEAKLVVLKAKEQLQQAEAKVKPLENPPKN